MIWFAFTALGICIALLIRAALLRILKGRTNA